MLSKEHRLSRRDFVIVKKSGKNFTTPHFSAVVFKPKTGNQRPVTGYSVVTSTKLSKKAVTRNHLRRLIYDSLKANSCQLKANIIIYPKPSMLNLSSEETGVELNSFLSKIAA
jgi:ribonuclease P protein component